MSQADRPNAVPTIQEDDLRVRVTRWDFGPGAQTGWHRHGLDYVVVPVTECRMLLEEPSGASREVTLRPGATYVRAAGVEHNVINAGGSAMTFVEVELKDRNSG